MGWDRGGGYNVYMFAKWGGGLLKGLFGGLAM